MSKVIDVTEEEMSQLDWIKLQNDMDTQIPLETQKQKLIRKFKENPFVPIGCLATTFALCFGLYSFKSGKRKMSQYMMRTRVLAQGFTIFAMIVGIGISATSVDKKI